MKEEVKYPLYSVSRLRMTVDGEGVTSLVASVGCPLKCAYCINKNVCAEDAKMNLVSCEELYEMVKMDHLYFLATGGGLTFGGGESLLHADFIKGFIERYKDKGWKYNVETSLNIKQEQLDKVCDLVDFFIVDTKDMNKERYEKYTKGSYDVFYNNLLYLLEKVGADRIKVRVPLIKDYNTKEEQEENVAILEKLGFNNIDVFDYVIRDE